MNCRMRLLSTTLLALALVSTASAQGEDDRHADPRWQLYEKMRTAKPAPNPPPNYSFTEDESTSAEHRRTVVYDPVTRETTVLPASATIFVATPTAHQDF